MLKGIVKAISKDGRMEEEVAKRVVRDIIHNLNCGRIESYAKVLPLVHEYKSEIKTFNDLEAWLS